MLDRPDLTGPLVRAAFTVHRTLGPGLLESAYRACLAAELTAREISYEVEVPQPVLYRGERLDCGYRMDMLVGRTVVVELKAVNRLRRVHTAQIMSYIRLADIKYGLLINFHVNDLRDGVRRLVL